MLRKAIQVFAYAYYFSLTSQPNRAYSRSTIRDEAILLKNLPFVLC